MQVTLVVGESVHLAALRVAQDHGALRLPGGNQMNSSLRTEANLWFEKLWDGVRDALLCAVRQGYDMARPQIEYFNAQLAEAGRVLQDQIEVISAQLVERLNLYVRDVMARSLNQVESSIEIGGRTLVVKSVTLQQSLKLASTISVSVTSICQMIAEGQLTISAQYATE